MKRTILVDMDGPLANFDASFWRFVDMEGFEADATMETQTARYATDHLLVKADVERAREAIRSVGWFRCLPVVPGAVEGIHRLTELFDVWICTKPLADSPTCIGEKAHWIRRHLPEFADRLIIAPNKARIAGHVLLDDAPKLGWMDDPFRTWHPVIFPAPFNGPGSRWAEFDRWQWGDSIELLAYLASDES